MLNKNRFAFFAGSAALLFAVLACGAIRDGKPAADSAVIEFHSRLNEAKYKEIFDTSHQELKDVATEEDMTKLLTAVHSKLGMVVDSKSQTWKAGTFNLTTTVQMVQLTEFEHGKADETFVFIIEGKKAILQTYHINSMDLIVK
jgi:hypothetical protein